MEAYIQVKSLSQLYAIQHHEDGELAYVADLEKFYVWHEEDGWQEISNDAGLKINLYDLNKSIVDALTPMTIEEISAKLSLLEDYYNQVQNDHHMLLCRDYNYYTIFQSDCMMSFPTFGGAVCNIITELGDIYSIDRTRDNALEIWIKPTGEEDPLAFYLFPYDAGVVYYG